MLKDIERDVIIYYILIILYSLKIQFIERMDNQVREADRFYLSSGWDVYCIFMLSNRIIQGLNYEWDVTHYYK